MTAPEQPTVWPCDAYGDPVPECDSCALPITETDAPPHCGVHPVHAGCAEWLHCRECAALQTDHRQEAAA